MAAPAVPRALLRISRPIGIGLVLLMLGCVPEPGLSRQSAGSSAAAPAALKRITAALPGDPPTLYENINQAGAGAVPGADAFETMYNVGLVTVDNAGALRPLLAEAVPSVENGLWQMLPDGRMETTWRLREGATWHDGVAITSADLLFTAAVERDRELPFRRAAAFDLFERLDTPDTRTLIVTWKQPFIWADATFSSPFMPRHLLEAAYRDNKASFVDLPFWTTEDFVGNGPFRLRELSRGAHALLTANAQYSPGRPKIDEILVRFIPDSGAMVANLLAGDIDVLLQGAVRGVSIEQALQIRERWPAGRLEKRFASWFVAYPQFIDPSPPALANVEFRRALLQAVDRQQLVDSLQGGMTAIAHSMVSPRRPEYAEVAASVVRYDYDPRRAGQLIERLGYTMGPDSLFLDGAGRRLSMEARATSSDVNQKTLLAVSDYWQRAGIAMDPVVVPPQRANDREYRATFPGMDVAGQPFGLENLLQYFHSREARVAENGFTGENRARYRNAELDALLDRYAVTIPRAERNQVLASIMAHMTDQLNVLGLFYTVSPTLVANRLLNAGPAGDGGNQGWNVHEWELRSETPPGGG